MSETNSLMVRTPMSLLTVALIVNSVWNPYDRTLTYILSTSRLKYEPTKVHAVDPLNSMVKPIDCATYRAARSTLLGDAVLQ